MYFGKKNKFDWAFGLGCCDAFSLIVSLGLVHVLQREQLLSGEPLSFRASILFGIVSAWMLRSTPLYTWDAFTGRKGALFGLGRAFILAAATVAGIRLFFFRGADREVALTLEWLILFSSAVLGILRQVFRWVVMDVMKLIVVERIAFAGWSPSLKKVVEAYRDEMGTFHILVGFFAGKDPAIQAEAAAAGYRCLGTIEMVETMIEKEEITLIIIDERGLEAGDAGRIVEICSRHLVNFKIIPSGFDVLSTKATVRVVAGVPVVGIHGLNFDHYHNRIFKRAVDIVGALVGLILFAPVIAVAGFLIYRESPGPIFYRQVRLGLKEKPFRIIKLRSMRLDAESASGAKWAVENDPRRLKIGTFLRKSNLDEVPQFWNVLKGEMSLVGPRPERPEFTANFRETIPHYNLRHTCRPGLTGWAAVNGLRGNTSLEDRLTYDIYYLENWSLMRDFKIILMTLFPPKNAY
ncbi:exopolysaccharide biosynthesis polyprenyl glycosylphosphotransferase [Verrucomicrobium sp. GAS474]|uniref:exopolysaccharide biosynthesis polyprenyl glycosylphosphotransferase n=1 Tax=Verrucomicrobium sp. GAS474 TaxID=1882831 RepID=UPI00087D07CE|nr:exopolysaccharide biosynthesis polyprenyl glycosylphosphotransferase [Verrucomicrobium sp. GAS474]SDU00787.1 exopolysaccharide biosynthesis polyprenyl glycosylphosphotransferase [Verrucomicrobium sp. GAS474]